MKTNDSDPYTLAADALTPQSHVAEFRLIANDGAFTDTFEFSFVVGSYHYLIWNPDLTPAPGITMNNTLASLGYVGSIAATLPAAADLEIYQALFVCVGIYPYNHVIASGSAQANAIVSYLNGGGNVYLEGGDVWYYDPLVGGYNFCPLFGIQAVADGTNDMGPVVGENGTFTEGMNFNYAGENSFMDHINPTGTGFLVFKDGNNNYNCGVANVATAGYKTVGTSFELGGLVDGSGASTKAVLLDSIMHFFGITAGTGVDEITNLDLRALSLQVTPNPFTKLTTVSFGIEQSAERRELKIYDAAGRMVRDFSYAMPHAPCAMQVAWDGRDDNGRSLSSGVYFVRLSAGAQTATQKIVLVD
ncbi:T9SS type A sorting domain-containing protein [candidate division WOR-3 bacterium]|nr:T9SS type A sorting domain-containing protein [candidate division WOR-3 bacterium]